MLGAIGSAFVLLGVSAAGATSRSDSLQAQVQALQSRARHALLGLYALDTRLHDAQSRLATLEAQAASLRREDALLRQQLSSTRRTLSVSRRELATNLRVLYKQGDVSPLAVVLGAQSLDDAVTQLDALTRVTDQTRAMVTVTTTAQTRIVGLRQSLSRRRTRLNADVVSTRQTAQILTSARTERLGFIGDLRSRAQLKSRELKALQEVAAQVEQKSAAIQIGAAPETVLAPAPAGGRTLVVSSTGYSLSGHTATGLPVGWGVVAVDPSVIPLGTRLTVPGYGEAVAADTGSGVQGADIDLWFPTLGQARAWGRRAVTVTLH